MSVYKREDRDGAWYVSITYDDPDTGRKKRLRKKSPIQTKRDAQKFERELRREIETGEYFRTEAPTLVDFAQEWMDVEIKPNKSENTWLGYRSYLNNQIIPALGPDIRLDQITTRKVTRMVAHLRKDYSDNTVKSVLTCLKSLLRTAKAWGHIDSKPDLPTIKVRRKRPVWMDRETCQRLVDSIDDQQARAMVTIAWKTGVRKMELAGLKWDDLDVESRTVDVCRQLSRDGQQEKRVKAGKRTIPLTETALSAFQAVRARNRDLSPYIFYDHDHERPWDANQLRDLIKDVWPDSIDKGPGWHILRHSFASQLAKEGVSLKKISVLLGHASVTTTEIYAHLQPDDLHADLEALEG